MNAHYEDESDVHARHRAPPPPSVRYMQNPPVMRSYHGVPAGPSHLRPEQHNAVVPRSRSREISSDRRSPPRVLNQPVIINNHVFNEISSDDDDSLDLDQRSRHKSAGYHRHYRGRSAHHSRSSSSRSRSRSSPRNFGREEWEAERARVELARLRIAQERETDDRRLVKESRDEDELRRARHELDEIRKREDREEEIKRISKELELKRLKDEEELARAKKARDQHAEEAIEKYKKQESERQVLEKKQREAAEIEYQRRLREDLTKSGLDRTAINAILNQEKIPVSAPAPPTPASAVNLASATDHHPQATSAARPTYTRMSRKYLSIETLREFHTDYELDPDPEYLLIKRWVPEWEQDQFWRHTKHVREKRGNLLVVEDKKHHRHHHQKDKGAELEWVRKKHDRRRSKSPGLLMYFAGAKPA